VDYLIHIEEHFLAVCFNHTQAKGRERERERERERLQTHIFRTKDTRGSSRTHHKHDFNRAPQKQNIFTPKTATSTASYNWVSLFDGSTLLKYTSGPQDKRRLKIRHLAGLRLMWQERACRAIMNGPQGMGSSISTLMGRHGGRFPAAEHGNKVFYILKKLL